MLATYIFIGIIITVTVCMTNDKLRHDFIECKDWVEALAWVVVLSWHIIIWPVDIVKAIIDWVKLHKSKD